MITLTWNDLLVISYRCKAIPKHSQHIFLIRVLLTLISFVTIQKSVFAKAPYSIQVSAKSNRANSVSLESKILVGNLYISKRGKTEIISQTFSIANPKANQSRQAQKSRPSGSIPSVNKSKPSSHLLLMSGFEREDLRNWGRETCCDDSVKLVSSPVRSSTSAVRFYLRKNDPDVAGSRRAEFFLLPIPSNVERWYGFSIFLPENWATDHAMDIVAQWHEYPDFSIGESWRSPPLSLSTMDGNWHIGRIWDPNPLTLKNTPGPGGGAERIDLGGYTVGVWTDWIIHVKWSHRANGLLEIWKNGTLVVQRTGPNTYNDQVGPYFKIGVYKPDWKYKPEKSTTETRTIYFDEVRIGDESANYADISLP